MSSENELAIEKLLWKDVRDDLNKVNPTLVEIIDQISPSDDMCFYKAIYPYGALVLEKGLLNLPRRDGTCIPVSIAEGSLAKEVRQELEYSDFPLAASLNKTSEIFVRKNNHSIPIGFLRPGDLFGLFEVISSVNRKLAFHIWNLASGAQTTFMLPRISDINLHKKLWREFKITPHPPKDIWEHNRIFAEIANIPVNKNKWENEVVFFSSAWINLLKESAGLPLSNYIYQKAWEVSEYLRNHTTLALIWETLSEKTKRWNLRPKPYIIDTAMHLLLINSSCVPGFQNTGRSLETAPTDLIEDAYINVYGLKDYLPIIMQPNMPRNPEDSTSSYYSLSKPTLVEGSPSYRQAVNIIFELRELKSLLNLFMQELEQDGFGLHSNFSDNFEFFHLTTDPTHEIQSTKTMPLKDKNLLSTYWEYSGRDFPAASPFLKGCLRITNKLSWEHPKQIAEHLKVKNEDPVLI